MYDSYATGPYVSPCGFADSQRPFVWMRSRISPAASAGPHAFRLALDREVPPRRLAVRDALRADHAGVADVDHVRRLHVQPDAKAAEEDRGGEQDPRRPDRARRRAAPGHADPHAAQHDPDERGIEERHGGEHVAVVEVPERRRRREQHHEIEVAQRERPAQVGEPDQEHEAERAPDPRAVDLRAAERALVAARHLPRDLRPGPRLRDDAARVVDRRPRRSRPPCRARSSRSSSRSSGRTSPRPEGPSCPDSG